MAENKTKPGMVKLDDFLGSISEVRRADAMVLMRLMQDISHEEAVVWGPSIIGFGSQHYKYNSGHEGDMPRLAFSPRKASITIYFNEGFDMYGKQLARLGKYKHSLSCLYINKLTDVDTTVLDEMLRISYDQGLVD